MLIWDFFPYVLYFIKCEVTYVVSATLMAPVQGLICFSRVFVRVYLYSILQALHY